MVGTGQAMDLYILACIVYSGPWSGPYPHVTDRSGRIGLVRGKRTVRVIASRLFSSPAKDLRNIAVIHVDRERTTLQYFVNFSVFKCKSDQMKRYMNNRLKFSNTVLCSCSLRRPAFYGVDAGMTIVIIRRE